MKKLAFSAALSLLLFPISGFATTIYDNFTGYSDYWNPLGNPNTATYGETFTAPSNGDNSLDSFSFYMGTPTGGDIILSAYIATWTVRGPVHCCTAVHPIITPIPAMLNSRSRPGDYSDTRC